MKRTIAVEVDIIGMSEMARMWWTRHDQNGLYLALKIEAGIGTLKVTLDCFGHQYFDFLLGSVGGAGFLARFRQPACRLSQQHC